MSAWLPLGAVGLLAVAARVVRRGSPALASWYHGTSGEDAARILRAGIDVERERRSDPGDFGWGVYLAHDPERARSYGPVVLEFLVEEAGLARIPNPYFVAGLDEVAPVTEAERRFHALAFAPGGRMRTVQGRWAERVAASREIRDAFLAAGYAGIRSDYLGGETVIFDPSIVRRIRVFAEPA